jgi:hypothetical protein
MLNGFITITALARFGRDLAQLEWIAPFPPMLGVPQYMFPKGPMAHRS